MGKGLSPRQMGCQEGSQRKECPEASGYRLTGWRRIKRPLCVSSPSLCSSPRPHEDRCTSTSKGFTSKMMYITLVRSGSLQHLAGTGTGTGTSQEQKHSQKRSFGSPTPQGDLCRQTLRKLQHPSHCPAAPPELPIICSNEERGINFGIRQTWVQNQALPLMSCADSAQCLAPLAHRAKQ